MDDKRKALYDALSGEYNLGSYEEFTEKLNDENKRKALYDAAGQDYNLGTYEEYSTKLGFEPNANKEDNAAVDGSVPMFDDEPNASLGEPDAERGFGAGAREGWKGLKAGFQNLWGETANVFTGSSQDSINALNELNDIVRQGKDVAAETENAWTDAGREIRTGAMELLPGWMIKGWKDRVLARAEKEKVLDDIREALGEAGGDVDKARAILEQRAQEMSYGDEQIAKAAEMFADVKPTEGFGAWVGSNAVQMIPSASALIVGAVTKSPAAAKAIGMIGMGGMTAATAGTSMYEARQAGASNQKVWKVGITDGMIEYLTEKLPFDRYTSRIMGKVKGEVAQDLFSALRTNKATRTELEKLLVKANERLGGKLFSKKNLKDYLADMLAEGASEFSAEALQTMTSMMYENPEDYPTINEILTNGWEGAKAGFFMGAVLGGASKTMEHTQNRKRRMDKGSVDVALVDFGDGEKDVAEVVEYDAGSNTAVVLHDGSFEKVSGDAIADGYRFSYEEFENARLREMEDEAVVSGNVTEGQIQGLEDNIARDIEEIKALAPEMTESEISAILQSEMAVEPGTPLGDAVAKYQEDVARHEELVAAKRDADAVKKEAIRTEIETAVGQRFWVQESGEDDGSGIVPVSETVEEVVYADGRVGYVVGSDESGNLTMVYTDGTKGFSSRAEITEKENSGEILSNTVMGLDDYLAVKMDIEEVTREKARMQEEHTLSVEEMIATHPQGSVINVGTEEAKIEVPIIAPPTKDGVIVQMPDGTTPMLTWEDVAHAEKKEITPKTNAQLNQSIVDEYRVAYTPAAPAASQPTQQKEEQVKRTSPANPLPLKADGSVDQTALWNKDPEGWAKWNDEKRQDGGADSLAYVTNAIAIEQAKMAELQAVRSQETDFDRRDALDAEIATAQERINRLVAIQQGYLAQPAVADAVQNVQPEPQTEEEKAKAEDKRREPLRKRAKEFGEKLGVKVNIAESLADVKEEQAREEILGAEVSGSGARFPGWYDRETGEVTIYLPHVKGVADIDRTIVHEVVAHKGLRGLLGKEGYNVLCDAVWDMMTEAERAKYMAYPGVNGDKRLAADEYIARFAEGLDLEQSRPIWNKIAEAVQKILNSMGIRLEVTKEDLADLIAASYMRLQEQARAAQTENAPVVEEVTEEIVPEATIEQQMPESIEKPADPNGVSQEQLEEINKATGGEIETGKGKGSSLSFSVVALGEGAGIEILKDDGQGNVAFVHPDGRIFNANNPIKPEDLKTLPNTVLGYMMKDAKSLGVVDPAKERMLWNKYTLMLNAILSKGSAENGGYEYLSSQWQWIGDTIYKTVAINSDSQYSFSLDITRVCKKNEAVINAIAEMQARLGYGITPGQIMDIYLTTSEEGCQVPCPVCYVFSRYIRNGKYATIMINGQRKYGSKLVDPKTLTPAQQKKMVQYWLNELDKIKAENKANSKEIAKANSDITTLLDEIDKLSKQLTDPSLNLTEEQKNEMIAKIYELDARYKAALNVVSQASLDSWITQFAIHKAKVDGKEQWVLFEDSYMGFPEEMALDLRQTATVMRKYPAIQRFRNSRGAAAGKEITFVANNDLGDVPLALGSAGSTKDLAKPREMSEEEWKAIKDQEFAELKLGVKNLYQQAVQEKDPAKKKKILEAAKRRFTAASIYAKQQSLRGGQRMWSWSDNIERLAPDVFVNLLQLEMLGGALQSYSKQLEGIKLVASMNGYVNGSLMGKGNGYREVSREDAEEIDGQLFLKDGDFIVAEPGKKPFVLKTPVYQHTDGKFYVLEFDDVVGIDPFGKEVDGKHMKGLFELNAEYDRAGNIIVGMNDLHIRMCMADDRIFFIIPWHSSGANTHILAQMYEYLGVEYDAALSQDYTNVQSEKRYKAPTETEEETDEVDAEETAEEEEGKKPESNKISQFLVDFWNDHYENAREFPGYGKVAGKDFACGIEGGVEPSDGNGNLSASQMHYRELRDAIFVGVKVPNGVDKNGKAKTKNIPVEEYSEEWLNEIMNDEFLSQVYSKVRAMMGNKGMTNADTKAIYPYEYWDENSTYDTADINGARYLEYCRRLGYKPKFCGKLDGKPETDFGNFTDDKGYWKVLIDRRMYGLSGRFQDLTPVTAENFTPDLVDPEVTKEEFVVTRVADEAGTQTIVDKAIAREESRPGGIARVDYDMTLSEALDVYAGRKPAPKKSGVIDLVEEAKKAVEKTSNISFSFIGERGAANDKTLEGVARLDNLETARQMESQFNPDWSAKENEAALKIKIATGWERGADGKWRYEVEDVKAKPAREWLTSKKKLTLKDIVEPNPIFDLYPDLLDINIVKDRSKYNLGAYYSEAENSIKLPVGSLKEEYTAMMDYYGEEKTDGNFARYWKVMESDILHELQHAIQHREGFAQGGSPDSMFPEDQKRYNELYDEMSLLIDEYNKIPYYDRLMAYAVDARKEAERAKIRVSNFHKAHQIGDYVYKRLAGEVEARNASKRRDLSPEERRNTLLASTEDVARKDQIFLMDAVAGDAQNNISFRVTTEMKEIKEKAQADGTFMKAPNGQPTNLTEEQWLMVRTKNFIKWFGDWVNGPENASKVVDENGEPKVVYHQTNQKIYVNRETGENWDELGWKEKMEWDNRDDWEDYWEEQDFNTFSRVNARTTNEFDGFFFAPEYDEYHEYGDRTIAAFVNIKNPASREDYNIDSRYNDAGRNERIRLQEAGFDGVIRMDGDNVDEYIAFEPNQIKSATDNSGDFNPKNNDISFRVTAEQDKAYMDAVKAGDLETAQRMVIEAAKLAMPNTKVVDENGNPKVVYHGTGSKFYTFRDTSDSNELGAGYYFSDSYEMAERYATDETLADNRFRAEALAFDIFTDEMGHSEEDYDDNEFIDDYNESYTQAVERLFGNGHVKSVFLNLENPRIMSRNSESFDPTYRYGYNHYNEGAMAKRFNDGIIDEMFEERHEGLTGTQYVAFNPSQIKSADPVTYDNNGNVIPLSERFNPKNEDIRFRVVNDNQAIFVSNAAKAVEGIKQEKATPEQWLKMIEKNGGLKAGEDKWMGLSDWLKASDKKTLTKQEVLDFVNEHMIRIEETHYSNEEMEKASVKILNTKYPGWEDAFTFEWDVYMEEPEADVSDYEVAVELYNKHHDDKVALDEDGEFENMDDYEKVRQFGVELSEIYHGSNSEVRPIHGIREQYTTRGLQHLREIALTVPTIESWGTDDDTHFGDAGDGRAVAWVRFGEKVVNEEAEAEYKRDRKNEQDYRAEMEQKYGSLASGMRSILTEKEYAYYMHLVNRTFHSNERRKEGGKRVLVIDEIQSKRHQDAREKNPGTNQPRGYRDDAKIAELRAKENALIDEKVELAKEILHKFGAIHYLETGGPGKFDPELQEKAEMGKIGSQEQMARMKELDAEISATINERYALTTAIPDAPFEKNWHELAMKRMLRYAAENGYDVVAWTKGDQQAERYGIGGKVDSISSTTTTYGGNPAKEIFIDFKNHAEEITIYVDANGNVVDHGEYEGRNLGEIIGKELAVKFLAEDTTLSGDGLRIGGEGMKGFYDKILPAFMNKYGKKWGVKVEDIELPNLEEAGRVMHSVPVTEEMKASVMGGQVMFRMRTEEETPLEFQESVLEEFKKEYRLPSPTTVVDMYDRDAVAIALGYAPEEFTDAQYNYIMKGYQNGGEAIFDKETKRSVIFAKETMDESWKVYDSIFHENTHMLVDKHPELLELGEWLWQNSEPLIRRKIKETILASDTYKGQETDEMLSGYTGVIMAIGKADVAYSKTPEELRKHWDLIFNAFGYERKTEDNLRRRGTGDNSGRVESSRTGAEASAEQKHNDAAKQELSTAERRVIGEYFPEFNKGEKESVSFRFIGEKGAAALDKAEEATERLEDLAIAKQMEKAGKDARVIKLGTGWERGADNLWRYETADFSLKPTWINATTLEEAINDDELFKAYPELRKTKVRLVHNSTDVGGEFNKAKNSIVAIGHSFESMLNALVHEVQHAIQEQEGFEGGGNPMIANAAVAMEWMNKYAAIYDNSPLKKANNAYSDTLDIIGMMDDLRQLRTDRKNSEKIKDTISTILVRLEKLQNYLPAPELKKEFAQRDLWPSRIWDTYAWLDNYQGYIIGLEESESITDEERKAARIKELMRDSSGHDAYLAITGEVEARNAAKRRTMSYIERRQSLASETEDVAREDHIFIKGALEELAKVMEKMQKGNVSFRTSLELDEEFGDAWRNQQNEDGRHSTQVANTKSTYEKIGRYLEDAGMKGASILGASSGLGLGTQALREMGFQVDDVEPFPSENREAPTFSSYADIDKQYDVVISNAVLNVIPDDWRADVLHQMADAVKEGGKMIINTRPASNIAQQGVEGKTRITLDSPSEILVKRGDRIAAYQKGFTSEELAEWIKSELGEGWRVEKATKKNSGISGEGTAVVIKERGGVSFRTYEQEEFDDTNIKDALSELYDDLEFADNGIYGADDVVSWINSILANYVGKYESDLQNIIDTYEDASVEFAADFRRYGGRMIDTEERDAEVASMLSNVIAAIDNEDNVSFRVTGTPTDEVVANGLNLTPAQTAEVAANIFDALPEESREKIADGLNGNILGLQDAIMQIPASLATKENWNEEDRAMADVVAEEMTKMAGEMTRPFSAPEALWLLYNNLNKGNDLISQASRALVQRNLGFDEETLERQEEAKQGVSFRMVGDATANAKASMYNRGAVNVWTRLKESFVDMQASVEELVSAIEKATGKVAKGFENILLALNQQSSKGLAAMESYEQRFLMPMFDEVRKIMDKAYAGYDTVVRYVILKHGLERNKKLAQRDAKAHYQEIYDEMIAKVNSMDDRQKRTYLTNAQLQDADAKAKLATLKAADTSAFTEEEKNAHKRELAKAKEEAKKAKENLERAQKINSMSEQELKDELDGVFKKIENGTDSVYKELRKNDYSGISSMFYDQLGVNRKDYSTEEEYQAALMLAKNDRFSSLEEVEEQAEGEVESFEGRVDTKELWKRINAATKETLRQQYEANMISKDQYESLRNMFEYYVPLRGFKDNTAEDMYTYYRKPNSTGYTKPILGAEGRKTEAESPFGWIAAMAGSAIASNVKNEAKLALYYFVSNRPNNGIATLSRTWFVHTPGDVDANGKKIFKPAYPPFSEDLSSDAAKQAYEDWQEQMRELQKQGLAYEAGQRLNLGNAVVNISDANKPEHVVTVKVAGKDYTIVINGNPRAAQAINGELNLEGTADDYSAIFGPVLRWMSSVNTSYNPEFWITNLMRDMAFTWMAVNTKEDPAYRKKFSKNYWRCFRVIGLVAKNEKGTIGNSYMEDMYKDFVKYGGVTGYTQIKDSETWEKEIDNYLRSTSPESLRNGRMMRGMKTFFHAAHRFGESLEQVSRFAAFLTSREMGKTINEAIADAKEITVNFNRKGSGKMISLEESKYLTDKNGQPLSLPARWAAVGLSSIAPLGRRFIMFFNAAVQGLNSVYRLWKKNPKRLAGWTAAYFTIGVLNAAIHALLDDDDDYLDIPQYERRNSLMLGGNGAYLKWALPQEARAFYALGDLAVETILGRNPHQNVVGEAMKIATEVLPVNPTEGWKAFVPSVAIPAVELMLNEDYKGAPIYNEQKWLSKEERERTSKWSSAYQGTGTMYKGIAQGLNYITGGDKHDAGKINLQPEKMEHIVQSAFGGTIRTADKFINTIWAMFDPEEDVTVRQTPFLNRILTLNDERFKNVHVNEVFDYYKADADHALTLEKKYRKDRDQESLNELRRSDEYQWAKVYRKYKKALDNMKEKLKVAEGTAERKELMRQQDELKRRVIKEISEL